MPTGRFNKNIFPGARFGKLTVIERIPTYESADGKPRVLCRCDCGNETTPQSGNLADGKTKSCGCGRSKITPGKGYATVVPGAKFGRLTVIKRILTGDQKYTTKVKCRCECGKITSPNIDGMISGNTKSCGCLASERTAQRNRDSGKHKGFSGKYPKTYNSWRSVLNRCCNPKQQTYKDYGAKGIVVCHYLKESPQNLADLIGRRRKISNTIDRYPIHNGNYTCGQCEECKKNGWELNVRWASRKEQSNNRGDFNVLLTAFGKTLTRGQWQDLSGINEWRIHRRINELGWSVEKALTTPDRKGNCYRPEK